MVTTLSVVAEVRALVTQSLRFLAAHCLYSGVAFSLQDRNKGSN